MFCLVYQSRASLDLRFSEIERMLEQARENNLRANITGCLLLYDGCFVQYLEGNEEKVRALFEKIRKDPRNSAVLLLSQENIAEREFEEWSMAFENLTQETSQLQYLRLLVSTFFEGKEMSLSPNPTSQHFWRAVKLLLSTKNAQKRH